MCVFLFGHSATVFFFCQQKPIDRCLGIILATPSETGYLLGSRRLHVFDPFKDGFGVHLLKWSLISDLYDFVQVLIKEIMKKTIIFTTSMVICVNILHEHLKVYTQK